MPPTVLHVLPHTHWDREWYEPFEGYRFRLLRVVDDLIELLERERQMHFHFDGQSAAIEDYLAMRPDAEARVAKLVLAGRLAVGPWRILMDEFLCSPETILRNLRQGTATAERLGARPVVGYIPDSFGHIAQMPQILALAGMQWGTVWRGVPLAVDRPVFRWIAPDGTTLPTLYLATSYSNAATLPQTAPELLVRARRIVEDMQPFVPPGIVLGMNGSDHLGAQPHVAAVAAEVNGTQDEIVLRVGPLDEYIASLPDEPWPEWHGEMRSSARANLLMGVLSARMPLKQAEHAASTTLERYAEPLCVLSGFDPGLMLEECWQSLVENSAHDSVCGCGIDAVAFAVAARYERAARVASLVRDGALARLAETARYDGPDGADGLLVFNPSPFPRAGTVETTMPLAVAADEMRMTGPNGSVHAVEVLDTTEQVVVDMTLRGAELARLVPAIHSRKMGTLYVNGMTLVPGRTRIVRLELGTVETGKFDVETAKRSVEEAARSAPRAKFRVVGAGPPLARVLMRTDAVPALGWTTLAPAAATEPAPRSVAATGRSISNGIVAARANDDGTVDVVHEQTGARFAGIGLEDGADAGDEYTWAPPTDEGLVRAPTTAVVEATAGPVEARLTIRQQWRLPAALDPSRRRRARRTVQCDATVTWAVREGEPFVRVTVAFDNLAQDHRLRLRVPLPFAAEASDADTAFHVTRRGLAGEDGPHERCTPTFPSRRWVDVSGNDGGIAVMHRGLPEYEVASDGSALSMTLLRCVGWLSRQDCSTRSGPAGPMLPAPGAQLPGPHTFELALYPHEGDWRAGDVHRVAEMFVYPLVATVVRPHEGTLPGEGAGLALDPTCVQLSALERRAEGVDVRVFHAHDDECDASAVLGAGLAAAKHATLIDLTGEEIDRLAVDDATVRLALRPWQIATIRLR